MRKKTEKKKSIIFYLITTLIGLILSAAGVLLSSIWVVKFDTDYEKYLIFLLISAFFGAFISGFLCSKKQVKKRFLFSFGQGSVTGVLFFLLVYAFNSFSVLPISLLILPCGCAGGTAAGFITSMIG